ncbi:unnamed protein product [Sphagnum balticum]
MLVGQLLDPGIELYGLRELCWPGEGECDIPVEGVIDVSDTSVKDAFHLLLFGCLKVVPPVDKVVVLGDFNIELGHSWESSASSAVGSHHLHHNEVPSNNAKCLLDLVASFGLLALRDKLQVVVDFCHLLRNRFALLSPDLLDLEVEWSALECEISEATGQVVGKARPAHRHKLGFMQATLSLVLNKHCVLLGRPEFTELRSAYKKANGRVKKAVVVDADMFARKQAKVVKRLQHASRSREWA